MARDHQQEVTFFGVAWKATADESREYLVRYDVPYPTGLDADGSIFRAYRVPYQPVTILISSSGRIVDRIAGRVHADDLDRRVRALRGA